MINANQIAQQLVDRWIKEEAQYRSQVAEAMKAGTPYTSMAAMADGIRRCRVELQESFWPGCYANITPVKSVDANQVDGANGKGTQ